MKRYSIRLRHVVYPWLSAFLLLATAAAARDSGARLVSSNAAAVTFEIAIPRATIVPTAEGTVRVVIDGFGSFSPPGAVELPGRAFRIAVPQTGETRVSASVLEEEEIGPLNLARVPGERFVEGENGIAVTEPYYPPDPWASGGGPQLVEPGTPSFMGRQRVLPVRVNPLILDARGARLVRRLSVTVSFPGGGGAPAEVAGAQMEPVSSTWKRLYDDLLVNPDDVSRLRKPLRRVPVSAFPGEVGKRLKLRIPETGLYSIRADSLIAAGLSAGLSTGELALEKCYYDESEADLARKVAVPMLVVESPSTAPGIFDGEDRVLFYALGVKDDASALDTDALYTNDNVLWLEEEVAGAMMSQAPPGPETALISLDEFTGTVKYRKDTWYERNSVPHTFDFYFAIGPSVNGAAAPFTVHSPSPDGVFSLSLRLQGDDANGATHPVSFSVRNSGGTNLIGSGSFVGKEAKTFSFSGLSASMLVDGENELVITCDGDYKHMVNDFTIDYRALYVANGNALEFTVDPVDPLDGPVSVEIAGFTVNSGHLIEVTDPQSPSYRTLTPADFAADGGGYKLALIFDGSLAMRRFIVWGTGAGQVLPVRAVAVDAPSHLRGEAGPYHALVISHKNFIQRMADYSSWRSGKGYRLLTADVEDVYDEFNGGLPHAIAIRRFIKYGFDHWGIDYVLLVGDGNEDHKRVKIGLNPELQGSPPDYVPPFTYSTNVGGTYDDEVVASDKWFAFLDESIPLTGRAGQGATELAYGYPDVIIGRLPVGRDVELRAILNKMTRMEAPQPGDSWRRRIVLFSDDRWSGRGTAYRYSSYERLFEDSTEACGMAIERALPGGFDVQRLYLRQYTDPIHPNQTESGPAVLSKATTATRSTFTPALNRALNRGCIWYMFQGHANRAVLTTESAYSLGWYMDIDSLRTYTPFVFSGFGCHISNFALTGELNTSGETGPYGDCMSEQLLFKPGTGAVAAYASVGYEYLSANADLSTRFHRAFFQSPPADSVAPRNEYTGAHWILGEVVTKAEIGQIDQGDLDMILRYCLLGDPMLTIDPGPPLMSFEADWGEGYQVISPDTLRARNGTNRIKLRLTVSDIVAVGRITLQVNGEDWTDSLVITPLVDSDKTYARRYRADLDYTIDPADELLVFKVFTPDGREVGIGELPIVTRLRLFFNNYSYEIGSLVESPPSGLFILTLDSPAYFAEEPRLSIDGVPQDDIHFRIPDPQDSLHLEASFHRTFTSGLHVFTVRSGDFSRDFSFTVTGGGLVVNAFSFPNPFSRETNIVYSLNLAVEEVTIDIYTVSGLCIRTLEMPADGLAPASLARPHSVLWDGRDLAGDRVANGTYIYVIRVRREDESMDIKGKSVKLE